MGAWGSAKVHTNVCLYVQQFCREHVRFNGWFKPSANTIYVDHFLSYKILLTRLV
jgi:hypothetical protein